MAEITVEKTFPVDAATVWGVVGDPAGIADWAPAIGQSRVDDDGIRHLVFADGQPARERIVAHSDSDRSYTYQYLDGPLPLERYESTITVTEVDGGSHLVWSAQFGAASPEVEAELQTGISEIYSSAVESVHARLSAG